MPRRGPTPSEPAPMSTAGIRKRPPRESPRTPSCQMIHLGEQVMVRLRAKHDPARAEAEWLRLRNDLLTMLQKEMVPLAERIEGQGVSPFAFATLHQRLGDLFESSVRSTMRAGNISKAMTESLGWRKTSPTTTWARQPGRHAGPARRDGSRSNGRCRTRSRRIRPRLEDPGRNRAAPEERRLQRPRTTSEFSPASRSSRGPPS